MGMVAVVLSTLFSSFGLYCYQVWHAPNFLLHPSLPHEEKKLIIRAGSTFRDLQSTLHRDQYVADLISFSLLAKVMKLDRKIHPGHYVLKRGMTNSAVVKMLRAGKQTPVRITFNGVRHLQDLPQKVCRHLQLPAEVLGGHLTQPTLATSYGFAPESFLAMFLPDTYEVYWTLTAEGFVERMASEYRAFWGEEREQKKPKK